MIRPMRSLQQAQEEPPRNPLRPRWNFSRSCLELCAPIWGLGAVSCLNPCQDGARAAMRVPQIGDDVNHASHHMSLTRLSYVCMKIKYHIYLYPPQPGPRSCPTEDRGLPPRAPGRRAADLGRHGRPRAEWGRRRDGSVHGGVKRPWMASFYSS